MSDLVADLGPGEGLGGILLAVGEDRDDDLAGSLGLGHGGQTGAGLVDGAADGVQEGGAAVRGVGLHVEPGKLGSRDRGEGDLVVGVEEDQGHADGCLSVLLLLLAEEFVESGDGGLGDRLHGTGAVEDEGDFGEVAGVGGHGCCELGLGYAVVFQ